MLEGGASSMKLYRLHFPDDSSDQAAGHLLPLHSSTRALKEVTSLNTLKEMTPF